MIADSNTDAYQETVKRIAAVCEGAAMVDLLGAPLKLHYPQTVQPTQTQQAFVRVSVINTGEKKRTLSHPSRVTKTGMVDMQLCLPVQLKQAAEIGSRASDLLETAIKGNTDSVDFVKSFVRPLPQGEGFFQWRITANYFYDILEG